jgi:CelD/BcsL family acetyltransferase involved in cellulose biosynthesis
MIAVAPQRRTAADSCATVTRVRRFTTLDALAPYADDWDRLSGGVPFRSWTWLSSWWRHYGLQTDADARRNQLAVLGVFDGDGALRGIAPWYIERSALRGRVLRPLGSGEICSEYLSVLCDPAAEDAVLKALAGHLLDNKGDHRPDALAWDLLELEAVDAEDTTVAALVDRLSASGCTIHHRPGMPCWRLDLTTGWGSYFASLGKHLRKDLRRLERNLIETGRAVLRSPSGPEDLPRVMDIFVDLHQRRWTTVGKPGCFASPRFLAFFREVVPAMLRLGHLKFYWLEIDGKTVAAKYALLGDGVIYAYQGGVDPTATEYEPGKLILSAMLREEMGCGYREFDFLRGNEPYKARFGGKPRPMLRFRVVPRRTVPQMRQQLWLARYRAKEWVKRQLGRTTT